MLGRRKDPLLEVCARQLIEKLALAKCQKNLLLWLGLREPASTDPGAIKAIIGALCSKSPWKENIKEGVPLKE